MLRWVEWHLVMLWASGKCETEKNLVAILATDREAYTVPYLEDLSDSSDYIRLIRLYTRVTYCMT